nr:hypothetical protein BaRGS_000039 [Batillaria attramentaria]
MGAVYVFYDFTNQRTAAFANYTGEAGERKYRIVRRYDGEEGQLYVVDLLNDKCYKKKLDEPFRAACVPDKAKSVGSFYYGAGDAKLEAVGYSLGINTKKYKMEFEIAVTREGCVPIGESVFGVARGVPFMENVGFVDIKPGISDPSVFDVPSQCESVKPGFISDELTNQYKYLAIV